MKLNQLKTIVKECVKEAIQEELKDIVLEALQHPKNFKTETPPKPLDPKLKENLRESFRNVLGETAASFNSSNVGKPLQMNGSMDTASPNGKLPEGEISMDQIMGLMNK